LLAGENKIRLNIGSEEIVGALIGGNLATLEYRCVKIISDYRLNALGELLILTHCE